MWPTAHAVDAVTLTVLPGAGVLELHAQLLHVVPPGLWNSLWRQTWIFTDATPLHCPDPVELIEPPEVVGEDAEAEHDADA